MKLRHRFLRRLERFAQPATPRRIVLELAALGAIHFVLVQVLARARLLEHLLSPGPEARLALAVTGFFLVLRLFLLVLGPGWFIARLWLWISHPATTLKPRRRPLPLR